MATSLHNNHVILAKESLKELPRSCKRSPRNAVISFSNRASPSRRKNARDVQCCSVSSPSVVSTYQQIDAYENNKTTTGSLIVGENWKVRRMIETDEEMKKVATIQAEAFHEPMFLFDDLFFDFFKAEVLSGLLYRLRNSLPDRYACLVAESADNTLLQSEKEIVGVVDVTVYREESVLHHLSGAEEYLYVSGIAVSQKFRRQKVGTALLKACDALSNIWGFKHLVLRAYEDDYGAQKLYSNAGYRIVSRDPPWTTSWIGRRRRVLMIKRTDL